MANKTKQILNNKPLTKELINAFNILIKVLGKKSNCLLKIQFKHLQKKRLTMKQKTPFEGNQSM